jgi:DNA replication protein DnaC
MYRQTRSLRNWTAQNFATPGSGGCNTVANLRNLFLQQVAQHYLTGWPNLARRRWRPWRHPSNIPGWASPGFISSAATTTESILMATTTECLTTDSPTIPRAQLLTDFDRNDERFKSYLAKDPWDGYDVEHIEMFLKVRTEYTSEVVRSAWIQKCNDEDRQNARRDAWQTAVGFRYAGCTLDSFEATTKAMRGAVATCHEYADKMLGDVWCGNLVIYGGVGTGKDHLAVSVCRILFENNWRPDPVSDEWGNARRGWGQEGCYGTTEAGTFRLTSGSGLLVDARDAMHAGRESRAISRYTDPTLLVMSDPASASGDGLTSFQSSFLTNIIDGRYRENAPMIVTINCRDREQMEGLVGVPLVDRLLDGAMTVACDWPSYRKLRKASA